jgi:hypothetical protein
MRFRFPRATIFLMSLTFVGVFLAIDMGRDLRLASDLPVLQALFEALLRVLWGFVVTFVAGAVVYLILFALKQSGVQRFSHMQTWPGRK